MEGFGLRLALLVITKRALSPLILCIPGCPTPCQSASEVRASGAAWAHRTAAR